MSPTSISTSPTSISTSPNTLPSVLPTKISNTSGTSTSGIAGLAFTGANVAPTVALAALLLGGGLLLSFGARRPRKDRKH